MEIREELKTYRVKKICPKCKQGEMKPVENIVLSSYPAQYPHHCDMCGHSEVYRKCYPSIEYETVEIDRTEENSEEKVEEKKDAK